MCNNYFVVFLSGNTHGSREKGLHSELHCRSAGHLVWREFVGSRERPLGGVAHIGEHSPRSMAAVVLHSDHDTGGKFGTDYLQCCSKDMVSKGKTSSKINLSFDKLQLYFVSKISVINVSYMVTKTTKIQFLFLKDLNDILNSVQHC